MRKVVVFEGKDHQFYWRLVAKNGEIEAQSEGYTLKFNAIRAGRLFAKCFKDDIKVFWKSALTGPKGDNAETQL